jgi:hypothetical protein
MIGDGATDMQVKPPADAFFGFGGIVEREKVRDGADWSIRASRCVLNTLRLATLPGCSERSAWDTGENCRFQHHLVVGYRSRWAYHEQLNLVLLQRRLTMQRSASRPKRLG